MLVAVRTDVSAMLIMPFSFRLSFPLDGRRQVLHEGLEVGTQSDKMTTSMVYTKLQWITTPYVCGFRLDKQAQKNAARMKYEQLATTANKPI